VTRVLCLAVCASCASGCAALEDWDRFSLPAPNAGSDGGGADSGDEGAAPQADAGAIAFIQANAAAPDNMARKSLDVPFKNAQTAGNLNVVVIGWYDLNVSVTSVMDSTGNPYQPAGSPTSVSGTDPIEQVIWFAPRIGAALPGANVVTVTWDASACEPDVRVLEFRGVSALDVTAGNSGTDGSAFVTADTSTKNAQELIVAGGTSTNAFSTADPPYTLAIISEGSDIAEYRVVSATGKYGASAPLPGKSWVMQLATFY